MVEIEDQRAILIAGPTASGKSKAAIEIAEALGAEIINADAIQVYSDLEVLSARPTSDELARVAHRLFGHVDGAARYSVGAWLADIEPVLKRLAVERKPAVIVGGTGLYFHALIQGLSPAPTPPEAIRNIARARLGEIGLRAFRDEVLAFDPGMESLSPNDAQRHLRAFEVYKTSGVPLSTWQTTAAEPILCKPAMSFFIEPDRKFLYETIEARFDLMIEGGAIEEVAQLHERGLDPNLPVMKAVGVPELLGYITGQIELEKAIELAKRNSRRFAKRQLTWLRNRMEGWTRSPTWNSTVDLALGNVDQILGRRSQNQLRPRIAPTERRR